MATFDEFFKSLDLDEEGKVKKNKAEKGLPFEQIFVKWFLLNDPIWSSKIDKFLETGKDLGIDLIFQDIDGNKWAVQSKGYSPKTSITKESIDSFISASPNSKFYGRLLIASTDRIGLNADLTLKENKVVRFLLKDFRNSIVDFPSTINELSKVKKRKPFSRKKHQIKAINDVLKKIDSIERGQVLMACGTGKTLTSLWIKEDLKANQVLVLVPSLNLISQTLNAWRNNLSDPFEWQCVCSDKTVHKNKKKDLDEYWINDPSELGIPVTSDIEEIKKFLCKKGSKVLFSTYQSSELIVEAQKESQVPNFDIVFADEAHKCAGKISKDFSYVLDNKKIRANKRLFFTATPRVLSKRIKKQAIKTETEIASMDDPLIFGEVLHAFRFSDAIKQKVLTDYQVVVIGIDDILISEKIKNRDFIKKSDGEIIDAESLALQIALAKGIKKYDLNRIINFHSLIEGAKLFRDTFEKTINEIPLQERPSGKISCDYVEGKMTTEKRNEKIENLRNLAEDERKILGNAKCLSEGVDVPSLDGITFVDPKSSEVDIIQAVGRVIRYDYSKKEQKKGTILIPIYLQDLTNVEDQVLESRFSDVWEVIKALKFHDDVLKENIDNLRISFGKRKSKRGGFKGLKIHTDLPTERISINFINSIETLLIKNTSDDWLEIYGMFIEFKNENGHVCPPVNDTILGRWCGDQRERYKKGQISKERITLLNDVGFDWDPLETEWQRNFEEVKEFKKINGHTNINTKTSSLGQWCLVQRRNYRKGKLLQKRVDLLNSIGFDWDPNETYWQNRFEELKEFKKINGHTIVPTLGTSLGKFVVSQRMSFKRGELSQEKIDRLNSIGFDWDPVETEWQSNFEKLKEFKKKYGHVTPLVKTALGSWCGTQRRNFNKGQLSQGKIGLLNSIGFDWDPIETKWHKFFEKLKEFKKENGHSNAPTVDHELSQFVTKQRDAYKRGKLSQEKIDLLNSIGFEWDPVETEWQDKFRELKEFKKENGHFNLNTKTTSLGRWCMIQRKNYRKGDLLQTRVDLLNSIGFDWDPLETEWQDKFSELKEFKKENGHANPLIKTLLGRWCLTQKSNFRKGKLSQERINLLNSIGFDWDPLETEWQRNFEKLKEFKKENGHAKPLGKTPLGRWCLTQKSNFRKGKLSQERINLLNSIGFDWDPDPIETQWQDKFEELIEFKKENGQCNRHSQGSVLGKWCFTQRSNFRKGKLSQERINLLNSIGFDWDPLETEWADKFKELIEFKKKHGNVNPNKRQFAIGEWCQRQRRNYRKGILSKNKIELLENIGFDWDPLETEWQNWFKQLKEFKNKNGNKFPPVHKSSLGRWCLGQRSNYKKGKLSKDRIELLESIGFEWY